MVAEVRDDVLAQIRVSGSPEIGEDASAIGRATALTEIRQRAAKLPNPEQFISLLDEMSDDGYRG